MDAARRERFLELAWRLEDQGDRFLDASLRSWGTYVDVEHPVLGVEPLYGNPVLMDTHPVFPREFSQPVLISLSLCITGIIVVLVLSQLHKPEARVAEQL